MSDKQQPTEGCCLQLLSIRLLWLILSVPGVFATFCDQKVERERLQNKYTTEAVRLRTALKFKGGEPYNSISLRNFVARPYSRKKDSILFCLYSKPQTKGNVKKKTGTPMVTQKTATESLNSPSPYLLNLSVINYFFNDSSALP